VAVDKAKAANMPKDTIERAIKRGTGELEGGQIEELLYEGLGPANSQFVIKVLTDNKNRSASNIRHLFTKVGGSLGAVMWNFEQKGVIRISDEKINEKNINIDEIELELIDAGADDIKKEGGGILIYSSVIDLNNVKDFIENKEIDIESAEIEYVAKDEAGVSDLDMEKIEKFVETLDEDEDVSDYYSNIKNI